MNTETQTDLAENQRLYKLPELAKMLGRSTFWVRNRIKEGAFEVYRLPNLAVSGRSINAFLQNRKVS